MANMLPLLSRCISMQHAEPRCSEAVETLSASIVGLQLIVDLLCSCAGGERAPLKLLLLPPAALAAEDSTQERFSVLLLSFDIAAAASSNCCTLACSLAISASLAASCAVVSLAVFAMVASRLPIILSFLASASS